MPSYAAQIPVADRWAIVAYVKAEQMKKDTTVPQEPVAAWSPWCTGRPRPPPTSARRSTRPRAATPATPSTAASSSAPASRACGAAREKTSAGDVTVDLAYVKESILTPMAKIVEGYPPAMPPQAAQRSRDREHRAVLPDAEVRPIVSHSEIKKPEDISIPPSSFLAKLPMLGGILAVAGLGATLGSAFGENKARAMFSYLWAFETVLGVALGGLGWLLIDHTVRSGWGVVVRRLVETTSATLPVFALLWLPIGFLGFHELFPWSHETDAILLKKAWFLAPGFWYARAFLYLAVWSRPGLVPLQHLGEDGRAG